MADFERIRLVILGGAGVGKSCVVKRFLFKTYSDKYRATVEDLYNREYDIGGVTLKVKIEKILLTFWDSFFYFNFCGSFIYGGTVYHTYFMYINVLLLCKMLSA